jgi:hypothetical protein
MPVQTGRAVVDFPAALIDALQQAQRIVILSGAGISAESGLATFRDKQVGLATFGERIADVVAGLGGSWTFISLFALVLTVYTLINIVLGTRAWDPYLLDDKMHDLDSLLRRAKDGKSSLQP